MSTANSLAPSLIPEEDSETRPARHLITPLAAVAFIAAVSYALYRTALGPVGLIDTVGTLREGSTHIWNLQPGAYEVSLESNGPINVALSGSNCAVSHGQTSYRESCELQIAATLTVSNPLDLGGGSAVKYSLKARHAKP
jgi:hypothetical protein